MKYKLEHKKMYWKFGTQKIVQNICIRQVPVI